MLGPRLRSREKSREPDPLPLERCLAKTWTSSDGRLVAGRTVQDHCEIVGSVAQELLRRLPASVRELFPPQAEVVPRVHDVGKVCPTFQEKLYRAVGYPPNSLPELKNADPALEKEWGGHAAVSLAALKGCCPVPYLAEIAGQHHGSSSREYPSTYGSFGGVCWQTQREALVQALLQSSALSECSLWPEIGSLEQARLLAGLTIVADWIGSGQRFDDPTASPDIGAAVSAAGFDPLHVVPGRSFEELFSFSPLEPQRRFYEQVHSPGVYILEAPMGLGKTEAALYAAYKMLEQGTASGLYFALPTQLTSNRIYTRLASFLSKILAPRDTRHAHLVHGKSWLTRFLKQEMGADAAPAATWFDSRKRGLLAPFAVGTIDQALMAAMNVRHGAVRAFGLAGKVVVLDEVHSYDSYTGTILDALIQLLRHYGCTILLLSATLTKERRSVLTGHQAVAEAYPLVSVSVGERFSEHRCAVPAEKTCSLTHHAEEEALVEAVLDRAEQGQQVLWIENTVAEAQALYRLLAARASGLAIETGLLHSRFTPGDRERNESHWTALYGKGSPDRGVRGRILVGTQVLEQSLDIDADFLVTRFCPTDMLLQRLGRLWRHDQTTRPSGARREAALLHPPLEGLSPETAFGKTGYVYAPYVLYRSLLVWENLHDLRLPTDIRALLEATYAMRVETEEAPLRMLQSLEQERKTLQGLALRGLSSDGKSLEESGVSPPTRAGQREEAEVLLLRSLQRESKRVVLADGSELSLAGAAGLSWQKKQEVAARLTLNTVRVPAALAPAALPESALRWLSPWLYCGINPKTDMASLRVALIQPHDQLYDLYGSPAGAKKLLYRKEYGYLSE